MGKKYIIEMEDEPFCKEDGEFLYRVKGFNNLVFSMVDFGPYGMLGTLTPYTEPDLEQVRKEAYQKGYETGYEDGYSEPGKNQQEAYQRGLNDAWEAARFIADMPYGEEEKAFGSGGWAFIVKHTASEVIEKIRQYEQEKEEIKVGDEVELKCGVSPAIYMQGTNGSDEIYLLFNDGSCGIHGRDEIECKTGRHFPEIATVLEKMREESNG